MRTLPLRARRWCRFGVLAVVLAYIEGVVLSLDVAASSWWPSRTIRSRLESANGYSFWFVELTESPVRASVRSTWARPRARTEVSWTGLAQAPLPGELVPTWAETACPHSNSPEGSSHRCLAIASGWPFRSVTGESLATSVADGTTEVVISGAIPIRWTGSSGPSGDSTPPTLMPLTPHWPGLLANASLTFVLLVSARAVPTVVRTLSRTKAGLCSNCGYDLRGVQACPECGRRGTGAVTSPTPRKSA